MSKHTMRVAAIDIGSNSIHMVIAEVESDGRFRVLDREKEMVRLGHRTLLSGKLTAEAMSNALRTLSAFRTLAERHKVTRFQAVATSAVREAANGGQFVDRVKEEVGLRVKVIPGREEARLIHLGVRHAIDLRGEPSLIMDLGGGSLELILVVDERPIATHSLKLGVARLSEQFLRSDPPSEQDLAQLKRHIRDALVPILDSFSPHRIRRFVYTSGTLLNLVTIAGHQRGDLPSSDLNHYIVAPEDIRKVRRRLVKANRSERGKIKGLDSKRVDSIVPGALLADFAIRHLAPEEIVACTWALREGLLLDFIHRHRPGIEEVERVSDPRRRSVVRFARHLGEISEHGTHVARLAVELFDQMEARLALPPEARQWLEFAALLHDVGHHISHRDHHRHSYYLITNGELLGFRRDEIEIIAQTARHHQKGSPKDGEGAHPLTKEQRQLVRALSAILRVADGLDRSHYGVVRSVEVVRSNGTLVLQPHTGGDDAALELWEARRRAALLERLLGVEIDIRAVA